MSETAHLQEVTELVPVQTFAGQRWEKALPVQGGRVGGGGGGREGMHLPQP